jgi:uncharacterized delta-60 repeat protein
MRLLAVLPAIVLSVLCSAAPATARPGELDRTFAGHGIDRVRLPSEESVPVTAALDAGGRILVAAHPFQVARFTAGGRLDRSWGVRGVASIPPQREWDGNSRPVSLAVLPGGGAIIAGFGRMDVLVAARLTAAGALDPAFGGRGVVTIPLRLAGSAVRGVVPVAGGGLRLAVVTQPSAFGYPGGPARLAVYGLRVDGTLDPGFGSGGRVDLPAPIPGYASTGMLLPAAAGGLMALLDAGAHYEQLRLTAGGQVDPSFGPGAAVFPAGSYDPPALAPDGRGGIVGAGSVKGGVLVVRVLADGRPDPAFRGPLLSRARTGAPEAITVDPAGRILLASTLGGAGASRAVVTRLLADGRVDRGFGSMGRRRLSSGIETPLGARAVLTDALGRVLVVGDAGDGLSSIRDDFGTDAPFLARLRSDDPLTDLAGRTVTVTPGGRARVVLRCGRRAPRPCAGMLRLTGHGLRGRVTATMRAGAVRTVAVALGDGGARLARARARVTVQLRFPDGAGRTDPVDRLVRLRPARTR